MNKIRNWALVLAAADAAMYANSSAPDSLIWAGLTIMSVAIAIWADWEGGMHD